MKLINKILIFIAAIILVTTLYTIYDNNRINIVKQEVKIDNLPKAFDGFIILQISDLHGKRFGENQKHLLEKINNCQYDMIALTGDMLNYRDVDSKPLFDILDGIKNKTNMFYTGGNTGPWGYSEITGVKTKEGKELEEKGCKLLDKVYTIKKGRDTIWISESLDIKMTNGLLRSAQEDMKASSSPALALQEKYLIKQKKEIETLNPDDIKIAITHYPFSTDNPSNISNSNPHYNLIIAGHYHGGQFRISFYGAFYIPDPASPKLGFFPHGFFPQQDTVGGLKNWGKFQQYVSKGLGASDTIPLLGFRVFNTPEINLIKLVCASD